MSEICIIGAGLTGTLLSIYLAKRGYSVDVYEKRRLQDYGRDARRSIAMSLSFRGILALDKIGIFNKIRFDSTPAYGRATHDSDDKITFQNYHMHSNSKALFTVERKRLLALLIKEAEETGNVSFLFNSSLEEIKFHENSIKILSNNKFYEKTYKFIIGADGVFSKTRTCLEKNHKIKAKVNTFALAYKEFHINYTSDILKELRSDYVHVWRSKKALFVALPSKIEERFIANLYAPMYGIEGFNSHGEFHAIDFFKNNFPHLIKYIPDLLALNKMNPTNEMYFVDCESWNYKDKILLVGDSAHAIAPFYAMGMNLAFESCLKFDELLEEKQNNLGLVFEEFQSYRKPDTDAMFHLAWENFNNLLMSSENKGKIYWSLNQLIWKIFPKEWIPTYALVAFSNLPLRKVKKLHERKESILEELYKKKSYFSGCNFNSELILKKFKELMVSETYLNL